MTDFVDGHRWPAVTPDVPSRPETPQAPVPDQQDGTGAPADFPGFDVYPGYAMHADSVALHFPLTAVPALCALFPTEAGKIHAAALAVEQEAEWESDRIRGRQLAGGGA